MTVSPGKRALIDDIAEDLALVFTREGAKNYGPQGAGDAELVLYARAAAERVAEMLELGAKDVSRSEKIAAYVLGAGVQATLSQWPMQKARWTPPEFERALRSHPSTTQPVNMPPGAAVNLHWQFDRDMWVAAIAGVRPGLTIDSVVAGVAHQFPTPGRFVCEGSGVYWSVTRLAPNEPMMVRILNSTEHEFNTGTVVVLAHDGNIGGKR